ncbi:MAG: cbb3-type cytochrome c oxidase N-terminal domain-containing protein [Cytophagales bacterium]
MKKLVFCFAFSLLRVANAQEVSTTASNQGLDVNTQILLWLFGILVVLGLLTVLVSIKVILLLINQENKRKGYAEISLMGDLWKSIDKKFVSGDMVPLELESEARLPHAYDGIYELNNQMPPWLKNLFIGTIGFAVVYLAVYYVFGLGKFQDQEYQDQMKLAAIQQEEYLKKAANSIDESNVKLDLKDLAMLEKGKNIFMNNCKACHGENGEGGVGPNLTDSYWLHGNSINDVFKVVKYGVPEKGMIAWQSKMTPMDLASVSNFILSLQGSKPENAKQPEGKNYAVSAVEIEMPQDSTSQL